MRKRSRWLAKGILIMLKVINGYFSGTFPYGFKHYPTRFTVKEHLKTEYHYLGLSLDGLSATGRGMKETDRTKILIPHYDQLFHFSNKLFTQLKYDQDCTFHTA